MTAPPSAPPTMARGPHQLTDPAPRSLASSRDYRKRAPPGSPQPRHRTILQDERHVVVPEVVGEVAPVGRVEEHGVGRVPDGEPAEPVGPPEHVGGVDGARRERLAGREAKLGARERTDHGKALAERAPRVEI